MKKDTNKESGKEPAKESGKKESGRKKLYDICRQKLVDIRQKHLQSLQKLSGELVADSSGDVADQARQLQEETLSLARRGKLMNELQEIDQALDRIKRDEFGICEETGNLIEEKRLEAIPWTRLSLEGAEMREMEREQQILDDQMASSGPTRD